MFFVKSSNVYLKVKLMTLVNLKSDRSRNNQVRSDRVEMIVNHFNQTFVNLHVFYCKLLF